jgi:integrase
MKLTSKTVQSLQLPTGKADHIEWDDEIPGLGIRLRAAGSRNWIFQYQIGDKQRRMSLGAATSESFKTVGDKLGIRERADQLHARVKLGQDPAADKEANIKRASETFGAIAVKYLVVKERELRPRSFYETNRHISKSARPLDRMPLASITRRDIAHLLGTIRDNGGPIASNRLRSALSDFFGWAMSEGIAENNPVIGTNKSEEVPRDRVLKDHELRAIWKHAGDDHYGSILKLLLLTGQRREEIGGLRWAEIEEGAIHLPGSRTKNKRPHVIPLSTQADAILKAQIRRADDDGSLRDLVFGLGEKGFSGWSGSNRALNERIAAELGAPLDHWVIHDLRRTFATLLNDRLGVLPHVVEACINHVGGAKAGVAGVYNRALYLRERVEALNLWADHLAAIVGGHEINVTPLRRA